MPRPPAPLDYPRPSYVDHRAVARVDPDARGRRPLPRLETPTASRRRPGRSPRTPWCAPTSTGLPGREHLRTRLGSCSALAWSRPGLARCPAVLHAPYGGPGARRAAHGRPGGTEGVLLDPIAGRPERGHHARLLGAVQGGRPARLQLSEGGTEESVLRVIDVATGELVDDRSTGPATPPWPGCRAARPYLLRAPARPGAAARGRGAISPAGLAAPGRTRPADDVMVLGEGWTRPTTTACRCHGPGAGWSSARAAGTAPRNDVWLADLSRQRTRGAQAAGGAAGRRRPDVGARGPRRAVYVFTDRDAPRGRLAVTSPAQPSYETWVDLVPEDPEAVLETTRSSTERRWTRRCCCGAGPGTRSARCRCTDLGTGAASATCRCPGWARSAASSSGRRGGTRRGSATPTTSPVERLPTLRRTLRRDDAVGAQAPGQATYPLWSPARSCALGRRHAGAGVRAGPGGRARPASPDDPLWLRRLRGCRWTPAYSAGWCGLGGGRRRLRDRQPARGSEEGESWHRPGCASTSRTSSTTSTPSRAPWWPGLDHLGPAGDLGSGPTAGCSSRGADPRPRAVRRGGLLGAAARHGAATRGSGSGPRGSDDTQRPPTRPSWAGCWATRPTTTCATGWPTRPRCSRSSTATPGRPDARAQAVRGAAGGHLVGRADPHPP